MARGFRPWGAAGASVKLDGPERLALRALVGELQQRLGAGPGGPAAGFGATPGSFEAIVAGMTAQEGSEPPDDPVLARLLPAGYSGDEEAGAAAREFRRLTEGDLRAGKLAAAQTLLDTLGEDRGGGRLVLDPEQARQWLTALNDLRLGLGVVLGVTEDERPRPRDPQERARWAVYDWLTWLQATLIDALAQP